jgi:hypothetical protein
MSAARRWKLRNSLTSWGAALVILTSAGGAQAGEAYYLLMFGSQQIPTNPNYSHSWATFVRASWEGDAPCPINPTLEAHTISWLPASMVIRVWALCPECGANFELHATMNHALDNGERISMWGPYEIEPDLYDRAMRQIAHLSSGQVRYKANDTAYPSDRVSNCIHAVSSIAGGFRLRVPSPGWGQTASFAILLRLRPWIINRDEVHSWVGSALGLDQYPIIYRDWGRPFSGSFIGPLNRLFGPERYIVPTYGPPVR